MDNDASENWAENEFAEADFGDERRTRRLIKIAQALAEQPTGSLPVALDDPASLKAAYRFFENPANEYEAILNGHLHSTYQRMESVPLVLAVQDTTYLDWKYQSMEAHPAPYQVGGILHSTLAITPERVPLGILQAQIWEREVSDAEADKPSHKQRPIAEKESRKWLISLDSVIEAHQHLPGVRLVSIGDREADLYELFACERPEGVDLLVRAAQDRRLTEGDQATLWKAMAAQPVVATLELYIPRGKQRPARTAHLDVRWKEVVLRPPYRPQGDPLPHVRLWAVWAVEPNPPENVEAVEWMLLTTVAVTGTEEALERIEWYACRWGIELWHKVLKSGCKVEERRLQDVESLKRLVSVFCVIAWRILFTTMLSRTTPEVPCTILFEPEEWQAAYCKVHHTHILPEQEPTLREAVRMVARLGGFLGRKGDGEPGVQTLWKGFTRLRDLTDMYKIMQPLKETQ